MRPLSGICNVAGAFLNWWGFRCVSRATINYQLHTVDIVSYLSLVTSLLSVVQSQGGKSW